MAALVIGSFVVFNVGALPADNSTYSSIQNFGHFLLFTILGFIALGLVLDLVQARLLLALAVTTVILASLGLGVELFQKMLDGRTASVSDLVLDAAGMVVGYLLLWCRYLWRIRDRATLFLALAAIATLVLISAKSMVGFIIFDVFRPPLPIVRGFEQKLSVKKLESYAGARYERVGVDLPDGTQVQALRVMFSEKRYSGVIFLESGADWSKYEALSIKLFSILPISRQIELRINDRLHNNQYSDRYNSSHSILPGLNELIVPLSSIASMGGNVESVREMDINDITRIQIFSNDVEPFAIDIIKLQLL